MKTLLTRMSATEKDADFVITDLETGKKYRITDEGDKIEVVEGEQIPVDEFLHLFPHVYLPTPVFAFHL